MTTTIETLKEKIRNNKILVLRDFYCYHVSAQTYLNSFEKDSIEIDLENWRYRSSHKTCWAGDPPNIVSMGPRHYSRGNPPPPF